MSNKEQHLFAICNQLAASGKTPTTALVKNKYPGNVPMPMLLAVLKKWKQQPEAYADAAIPETITKTEAVDEVTDLKRRVAKLEAQVAQLLLAQSPDTEL